MYWEPCTLRHCTTRTLRCCTCCSIPKQHAPWHFGVPVGCDESESSFVSVFLNRWKRSLLTSMRSPAAAKKLTCFWCHKCVLYVSHFVRSRLRCPSATLSNTLSAEGIESVHLSGDPLTPDTEPGAGVGGEAFLVQISVRPSPIWVFGLVFRSSRRQSQTEGHPPDRYAHSRFCQLSAPVKTSTEWTDPGLQIFFPQAVQCCGLCVTAGFFLGAVRDGSQRVTVLKLRCVLAQNASRSKVWKSVIEQVLKLRSSSYTG